MSLPDITNGVGDNLGQEDGWKGTLLHLLDDKHGGWGSSNERHNVIEDLFNGLHASGLRDTQNLGLQLLQLNKVQRPHVERQGAQLASNIGLGSTRLWGLVNFTSHLLDLFQNLWNDLFLWQVQHDVEWSLGQSWLWQQWAHAQKLFSLLDNFLAQLLFLNWESIDDGLDDLGGGWDWQASRDWLDLQEGQGDQGWGDRPLLGIVSSHHLISNHLVSNLADNKAGQLTTDISVSGRDSLKEKCGYYQLLSR